MAQKFNGWLPWVLSSATLASQGFCATATPALQISSETAPAGGWAQIKIYAVKPQDIASGHLVLNLDATAFGPGATVGLFGANGDATGLATTTTTANQIDVRFSSPTGGIGQLPGLPVAVISIPVLAAASGRTVVVSATSPDSSVTVASGSVTAQGTLSVQKVPAGMGVVPAGTVVPVYGGGFTTSTQVTMDGVELSSINFVSPQEIDVTIGGATELVGKLARVTESGTEFDYFCFQPNDPVNFPGSYAGTAVSRVQPLFPLFAGTGFQGYVNEIGGAIEVQNPNSVLAMVTITSIEASAGGDASQATQSIPPGSWTIFGGGSDRIFDLSSNLPVRIVSMSFCNPGGSGMPVCLATTTPYDPSSGPTPEVLTPPSLAFAWQLGSPSLPAPRNVIAGGLFPGSFVPTGTVTSGQPWVSVTNPTEFSDNTISVSVNPSQLAAGTYQGSISVAQIYGPSAILPVSLTVTAAPVPTISVAPASLTFNSPTTASPISQAISVTSNAGPAAFTVTTSPGTWLKISPMSGTTPATLTATWDPNVIAQLVSYDALSAADYVVISGLGNMITVPVTFNLTGIQVGLPIPGRGGLVFSSQMGGASQTQPIGIAPLRTISVGVDQTWMIASTPPTGSGANETVFVTVNPTGLAPGVYTGNVTIGEPGLASLAVPVAFGVWSTPPLLTVTPSSFTFVQTVGEASPPNQYAQATSGSVPIPLTLLNGTGWLGLNNVSNAPTPARILVVVTNPPQTPGQYNGSFTVQSPGNSVYIPVTLLIEPSPTEPPALSQAVNAASGLTGGVSPGEILSIRGYSSGAGMVGGLTLTASGAVATSLNGLQVTFDGKPAPLIYTSANQTNLIVPYEVAAKTSTIMELVYATATGTMATASWTLPVVAAAPGIFTVDSTGTGQGAIVNQDTSINSAANPAARGSAISIYATGEGQTSPAGVTGSVTQSNTKAPLLPVTVTIGGTAAVVQYAASTPDEVAGVLQVNAVVPQSLAPGSAVPVTVSVGGIPSQANVTIAVK